LQHNGLQTGILATIKDEKGEEEEEDVGNGHVYGGYIEDGDGNGTDDYIEHGAEDDADFNDQSVSIGMSDKKKESQKEKKTKKRSFSEMNGGTQQQEQITTPSSSLSMTTPSLSSTTAEPPPPPWAMLVLSGCGGEEDRALMGRLMPLLSLEPMDVPGMVEAVMAERYNTRRFNGDSNAGVLAESAVFAQIPPIVATLQQCQSTLLFLHAHTLPPFLSLSTRDLLRGHVQALSNLIDQLDHLDNPVTLLHDQLNACQVLLQQRNQSNNRIIELCVSVAAMTGLLVQAVTYAQTIASVREKLSSIFRPLVTQCLSALDTNTHAPVVPKQCIECHQLTCPPVFKRCLRCAAQQIALNAEVCKEFHQWGNMHTTRNDATWYLLQHPQLLPLLMTYVY
jgi:hypothetical protein